MENGQPNLMPIEYIYIIYNRERRIFKQREVFLETRGALTDGFLSLIKFDEVLHYLHLVSRSMSCFK